jgi:ferritin-like metal-binding protein YciE
MKMDKKQLQELILQSLEHELGGVKVYETAIQCAQNKDLHEEWTKYLEETQNHVQVLMDVCEKMGLDPRQDTPGRKIVRHLGGALVDAMKMAIKAGDPAAAQIVACECVVLAETKDHLDWELLTQCAEKAKGKDAEALAEAVEEVEDQEDEHLYHTKGWCRELWIESLGMPAVLPPPEEEKHVKTAIGAARAEQSREDML